MVTIGVLSLQGSVSEHCACLRRIPNVACIEVKTREALAQADAMILPGGESTTIAKLLDFFGLTDPLRERIRQGMPVWGTCAGMILLAKDLVDEPAHLAVMDITVRRNAYGRQIDSFCREVCIPAVGDRPVPLVFIRAPWIERAGPDVEVLCKLNGHIVAAKQKNMLATSFHPELSTDLSFQNYFVHMILQGSEKQCFAHQQ